MEKSQIIFVKYFVKTVLKYLIENCQCLISINFKNKMLGHKYYEKQSQNNDLKKIYIHMAFIWSLLT